MSEHLADGSATDVAWFRANGRGTGILVLVLWAVMVVLCIVYGGPLALIAGLLVAAVLTYVTLLRPCVGTTSEDLVYRRMFSDLRIPLAAIDKVEVSRYFQVTVADKRYISPAVSRSRRGARRSALDVRLRGLGDADKHDAAPSYGDLAEDAARSRVAEAKARSRAGAAPREIRRSWAPVEIAVAAVAVVFLLVSLVT